MPSRVLTPSFLLRGIEILIGLSLIICVVSAFEQRKYYEYEIALAAGALAVLFAVIQMYYIHLKNVELAHPVIPVLADLIVFGLSLYAVIATFISRQFDICRDGKSEFGTPQVVCDAVYATSAFAIILLIVSLLLYILSIISLFKAMAAGVRPAWTLPLGCPFFWSRIVQVIFAMIALICLRSAVNSERVTKGERFPDNVGLMVFAITSTAMIISTLWIIQFD